MAKSEWKQVEGEKAMRKDYSEDVYAMVATSPSKWLGEDVYRYEVWTVLKGGRLDGTNYTIGQTKLRDGNAATVDEAKAACDAFAEKF